MKRLAIFDPEKLNEFLLHSGDIVEHLPYASGKATMTACIQATVLVAFECSIENFDFKINETEDAFIGAFRHKEPTKEDILNALGISELIDETIERLWGDTDEN